MKHWIINYSVKFRTGAVEEHKITVEAENIAEALGRGQRHVDMLHAENAENKATIEQIVIWDIGIVEMEVF